MYEQLKDCRNDEVFCSESVYRCGETEALQTRVLKRDELTMHKTKEVRLQIHSHLCCCAKMMIGLSGCVNNGKFIWAVRNDIEGFLV